MRAALLLVFVVGAARTALGCSLTTDLSGFSTNEMASVDTGDGGDGAANVADAPVEASADAGGPRFRRALVITNLATSPLPDGHAVCLQLPAADVATARAAGKLRADFGDLRVFGSSGERARVVDARGPGDLAVCFRLERAIASGTSDSAYSLSYGAVDLAPPSGTEAVVFQFFEGFDGAALSDRWLSRGGPTVSGGLLTLPGGGAAPAVTTIATGDDIPTVASLELRARVTKPNSAGTGSDFYWFGFQRAGDFITDAPYTVFYGTVGNVSTWHASVTGPCTSNCQSPDRAQSDVFRVYRIDRNDDGVRFTYDDGVIREAQGSGGDQSVMLRNFQQTGVIEIDWVRARPLVWPEPAFTLGEEESHQF